MRTNRYATAMGAVAFIIAAGVFWLTYSRAVLQSPSDETAPTSEASSSAPTASSEMEHVIPDANTTIPVGHPVRLVIPYLGIDANIQRTGISPKGNMGVPTNFTDVAWYAYGPRPGEQGSAVIDGHVDNGLSLPGVFKHLDSIATGTDVYVQTDTGQQLHFTVTEVSSYAYTNVPAQEVFSRSGAPRLELITCTGDWVHGGDTYNQRLVVTAEMTYPQAER